MNVKELMVLLSKYPSEMEVIYQIYSEMVVLDPEKIEVVEACDARTDGWVQRARPDKPLKTYLCFPGN